MRHPLGRSRNGFEVYVDLIQSKAARHIAKQPQLLGYIEEMLRKTDCRGADVVIEYDMGRIIGYDFVINTKDTDNVFYAQMLHDEIYTRFVKSGKPLTTQYLSVILHRSEYNAAYEVKDTWIGPLSPPRPGSANETAESRAYWATHAYILDTQPLQLRTVTKECPY